MSLTAPLEVLFGRELSGSSVYIGVFMLTSAVGVILIDVFGTRLVPGLDARVALTIGLSLFGMSSVGMGLAHDDVLLMSSRVVQGFGGGMMLGAGLQAAVRVRPAAGDTARAVGRFNAAFLFGGAVGSPGGLLLAGLISGEAGYRIAFVVTGGCALAVAAALASALPSLAPPPGMPRPRLGLPRFGRSTGGAALVLAMNGEFLRGGVLFTALPLAGAARQYSTVTIALAIALMSGSEIAVLTVAYRLIRRVGVVTVLITAFALGAVCATVLAVTSDLTVYLAMSVLFGVSLAGATASLPVLVVAQVGDSSAGLAKFRISAGIGVLAGTVGCAVLGMRIGMAGLFGLIAVVLLASVRLAHHVGRRTAIA
ncbi:MFS transporter [Streptomyces sp. NPDC050287]|uniref:MFS transporter n=1 Tax=Streptomyces sp. NPDC050287 TaxID=3365608 RepID=UPI0037B7E689